MPTQDYATIVSRACRHDADDLDDLIAGVGARAQVPGRELFPEVVADPMPEVRFRAPETVCVGHRVTSRLEDAADRVLRLAALAIEREVEIVVLTEVDTCGLERFGFRIERIAGAGAAREACELQVRRFWNLDLVI